jgi:hypothetical protein
MPYAPKIVLHCPDGYRMELDQLVERFIADGVRFVGVVGVDCQRIEDIVDELVVGDGSEPGRFILTSSHPNEILADAVAFARSLSDEFSGEPQVIELNA